MTFRFTCIFAASLMLAACQTAQNKNGKVLSEADLSQKTAGLELPDSVRNQQVSKTDKTASLSAANSNVVMAYVPPPEGTVFTWRNNWANLPELISYKVAGTISAGQSEYIRFTSVRGFKTTTHAFYDTTNFSLKGYRDQNDKAVVTFKPTELRYRFPMKPGDQWITKWKQKDHKTDRVTTGGGVVKAMRWETLKLPVGEVRALKIRMPVQKSAPKGLTHHVWFSPEFGVTVKEEIGGGILNWSQVLEKVERPG